MDEPAPGRPPLFPPWWFVQRYNEARWPEPLRTALDPMVLLAWHQATQWQRQRPPTAILISGA